MGFLDLSKERGASESKSEILKGSGLVQTHVMAHAVRQQLQVFFEGLKVNQMQWFVEIYPVSLKCSSSVSVSGK